MVFEMQADASKLLKFKGFYSKEELELGEHLSVTREEFEEALASLTGQTLEKFRESRKPYGL